ncbi:ASCH domain-containing protein [Fischerella sp. PCC 9605]|uniref:ASCH domain-containing protein n=1 Tax=Fischerella sp. PCC 9605 TaxID=1173024 RepID=UPI0012DF9A39|nr:ASCH domain-containing protein [Fischerella sp. PCC 9605]
MKAISLKAPWAWAIFHAGKDVENRSWKTEYRGSLLIHVSRDYTLGEYQSVEKTGRSSRSHLESRGEERKRRAVMSLSIPERK